MESIPLVSVVMITYGHESFIEEAINGVLMQECNFEIELIIANDCSPDKTDEVIQHILKTHPRASRINYIKHEKNIGMMPNFIYAMQKAKGKYIALCEGDDYWTDSYKLQKQFNILENNPEYKFCISNIDFFNQSTFEFERSILNTIKKPLYFNIEKFLINKAFMAPCTWFGTKECFFFTSLDEIETDGSFAIFMDILQNTKVYFLDESTAVYRILQESASNSNFFLKAFNYNKGLYKTQLHYIEKYNLNHLRTVVYDDYRNIVIKMFRKNYLNVELLEAIQLIKDDFNADDILIIMQDMVRYYQKEFFKINNSKSLLIGKIVTRPLIYIKNFF